MIIIDNFLNEPDQIRVEDNGEIFVDNQRML
jgi:hypothetical protein